jgi:cyclopropane fatty-acyl-phospholipid synthase-like methyltransferase
MQRGYGFYPDVELVRAIIRHGNISGAYELGCGKGNNAMLYDNEGIEADGCDRVPEYVLQAATVLHNVECLDLERDLPHPRAPPSLCRREAADRHYDLIVDIECLPYVARERHPAIMEWIAEHLRPDGMYFFKWFAAPYKEDQLHMYTTQEEVEKLLATQFPYVTVNQLTRREGTETVTEWYGTASQILSVWFQKLLLRCKENKESKCIATE